jgi:uncharacterized membrane protein YozB (DUF420 family)
MSTTLAPEKIKQARIAIISLSIAIPLIVAVLFKVQLTGYDFSFLPPIYATINGLTAFFLLAALYALAIISSWLCCLPHDLKTYGFWR